MPNNWKKFGTEPPTIGQSIEIRFRDGLLFYGNPFGIIRSIRMLGPKWISIDSDKYLGSAIALDDEYRII